MAGITFRAELSDQEARHRLATLTAHMENMLGFYENVGRYMTEFSIPNNFATETAPDGKPWASLSPVTLARRKQAGSSATTILQNTLRMRNSISARPYDDQILIGTPVEQAAVMQFGAAQGQFGARMGRTKPSEERPRSQDYFMHLPWGDIPARPFLGFSAEDEREVIRIAEDWLDS